MATEIIFDAKCHDEGVTPAPVDAEAEQTCRLQQNVVQNVSAQAAASLLCEEIKKLCCQEIKVENDNEPIAKNIWAQPSTSSTGQQIIPSICCCKASSKISNTKGKWEGENWMDG